MIYCYDCEVYANFFCVTFKDVNTKEIFYFEISRFIEEGNVSFKDDSVILKQFIDDPKKWFIGYNNHYYDNQLLKYIHESPTCYVEDIYYISNDIIKNDIRTYKYNLPFKSIDLMRVGNTYQKSLKLVACNLSHPKIEDLPIPNDSIILSNQVELIKLYNMNDVEITEKLYNVLLPQIKLRKEITQMYNINVMDESDSGIANKLLERIYSALTGLEFNQFKELRTNRDYIHFGDVIFKNISFQTVELKGFLDKLRSFVLIKDKTFFKKSLIFKGIKINLGVGGIKLSVPIISNYDEKN